MPRTFIACLQSINSQHGNPPKSFLNQIIDTIGSLPDAVFAENSRYDIYSVMKGSLGPYEGLLHRRAVMCEVLRVQAAFESDWNWNEGVDLNNEHSRAHKTGEETGAFQVSWDSIVNRTELRECVNRFTHNWEDVDAFITQMKSKHDFAVEYCARLLRFDTRWCGTITDPSKVMLHVRRAAVKEFQDILAAEAGPAVATNTLSAEANSVTTEGQGYAARVVSRAMDEYKQYHLYSETEEPLKSRIRQYWTDLGFDFPGVATAWSAVFVSWCMREGSSADNGFQASTAHSRFVYRAIQNQNTGSGEFRGRRINEYAPKPGDIIHNNRGNQKITYDFAASHQAYESHSAIVVQIVNEGSQHYALTIGGNESDSVGMKKVPLNDEGHVIQRDSNPFIAVVQTLKA